MSRVAKKPVKILAGIECKLNGQCITIKGDKGQLVLNIHSNVQVKKEQDFLMLAPRDGAKYSKAMAGTTRALISNMIIGVTSGFEKKLKLVGVGYRVQVKGKNLVLNLGFSHPVEYALSAGVIAEISNQNEILLKGIDKQLVGQVASEIRQYRRPEPYKGKGIHYSDEYFRQKEAKKK